MMYFWLFASVTLASLLMTAGLRRYALARSIIDIPNARSSHSIPTPRGGGVAIVVAFLLTLPLLGQLGLVPPHYLIALGGAGALVAIVGFMDDHGHIAARWRLLGHFSAAIWALAWLEGLAPLNLFGVSVDLSWIGHALAAFYLVWVLNLYNFMDGIDGIASIEAVSACLGASALYILSGFTDLIWPPLILAAAVLGFLFWNFPPAKIFMGDAGSGFLGIALGIMSLQAAWVSPALFWAWLILLGVFIVDATVTLTRRFLRGDKVYEAHRSHAYQFASRRYGRHRPVTMAVAAINVLWLFPLAWCVVVLKLDGLTGVVLAYVPLVILAFKFKAGQLEDA
ncbi:MULTISPECIES: MraY family glycosyltransferase [Pseudomonas]|jgi:UDP-N-acetylmuramyl pentapeptide phosphotransferase/UDP-N-acetylglucosamine-1-phosphate transferase|uniref:MraY family glycosyltransferase n=1 Tax=Pseudomonas TaxID=286 RepID=UPI00025FDC3D|nr:MULTISPECIES: glycosyltransferase family 4 protein [Pseudomonas]EIK65468.1 glycosyltransferase WbpL [Pseudomonas fluorescens Q8r1-96]ALQ02336.1 Undecaprenyl-phosphate N-acetylglucosaminyl 1-phosphate transferase [Pseudomonas brassicacearum]AOS38724.1 glycosyl transferase [Pseudomonas brassicacearum]KAB0523232.1 glycosyltransferase family 4 protein [Pseudomonas brassicacearum subsp. brassicacearum]NJP62351.1 glycosyltransferase family 4 protein [Pseudomonas brassicacearum]